MKTYIVWLCKYDWLSKDLTKKAKACWANRKVAHNSKLFQKNLVPPFTLHSLQPCYEKICSLLHPHLIIHFHFWNNHFIRELITVLWRHNSLTFKHFSMEKMRSVSNCGGETKTNDHIMLICSLTTKRRYSPESPNFCCNLVSLQNKQDEGKFSQIDIIAMSSHSYSFQHFFTITFGKMLHHQIYWGFNAFLALR